MLMNLEDHLGDIIRKARAMSSVSAVTAAKAAGLSELDLTSLEASGTIARPPDYAALGNLIGLDGGKLERIAKGWLPPKTDLGRWRELRALSTDEGGMAVNCFLVWDEATRDAALFDTGWNARPVIGLIAEHQLQLRHIFITHSHADHIAALSPLREAYPKAKVHSNSRNAPVDQRNKASEITHLGGLRVTYRETPGHAEDGVTYIVGNWQDDAPHVALVGDAIFAGSMGNGNQFWELARQKVREQILTLPDDTLLCPGHGPLTTVALEKANNPFF